MSGFRAAVLGGTGPFGGALAARLVRGGAAVCVGSREAPRGEAVAARIRERGTGAPTISGAANREAARDADAIFLAVPFAVQESLLDEIATALDGKLVVCCAVIWPPGSRPGTSAAEEAQRVLRRSGAGRARVAAAFQTVAAGVLAQDPAPGHADPDVLVFADREDDRRDAAEAAAWSGLRAVPVGALSRSRAAEAALGMLLDLNRGAAKHAGLRVTGLDP